MKTPQFSLTFALIFLVAELGRAQSPVVPMATRWPSDREAAIALTFDDALASQLEHAGPILRKRGMYGTFFVTTANPAWRDREADWKRLAAEGNESGLYLITQGRHQLSLPLKKRAVSV